MSAAITPATLEEVLALAEQMQGGHAESLALTEQLLARVLALPPSRSELSSRPYFERASKWTLVASFLDPPVGEEAVPQNIEIKHDMVIRGVQCQCLIFNPTFLSLPTVHALSFSHGLNLRACAEVNFRIDSMQGFQSSGRSEVLERAVRVTGDGTFQAPLDWELQQEQTIEVKFRNVLDEIIGDANLAATDLHMVWGVVAFWAEDRRPGQDRRLGGR